MSAALTQRLVDIARAAAELPHGQRTEFYQAAAAELGLSLTTLHRKLKEVTVKKPRKRRADAGKTALTLDEAKMISAAIMVAMRRNGKRLASVEQTLEMLRANGEITAARVDESTGECKPLSTSAISRALRLYNLHPDQVLRATPSIELASKHPNHVWQIDPSLCVLYYLRTKKGTPDSGLQVMDAKEFYKNKPLNLKRIENERVWRYVITDHTSGAIYVEYVLGAESGANLTKVFINAIQKQPDDPFNGVPFVVMVDPGSANTGAIFRNLCKALMIDLCVNEPGNPRAKGQVEKSNDIVEKRFESGLRYHPVEILEELNALARRWMRVFNGTAIHTRHGRTRYDVWLTINAEQLRLAPDIETCQSLAVSAPKSRTVTNKLTVDFNGTEYDVSNIPNVMNGEKIDIVTNPYRPNAAIAVLPGEDGHDQHYVIEAVERNELGFRHDAPVIRESHKRHADTPAQANAKELDLLIHDSATQAEAEAKRKAKALPFGGRIDAYKSVNETQLPTYIPKRGTELDVKAPTVEIKPLTHVEAAKILAGRMGNNWKGADHFAWLKQHYPEGVLEEQLGTIEQQLTAGAAPLRLIK